VETQLLAKFHMAASHRRQSSDPFRDNNSHSYERSGPRSVPLPPPKEDMLSAVRESVTVKPVTDPARSKTGRSHSSCVSRSFILFFPNYFSSNNTGTVTPPRTRRSVSTDSVPPPPVDKSGKPSRQKAPKKASMHADIIDRLDFSGVGAASMSSLHFPLRPISRFLKCSIMMVRLMPALLHAINTSTKHP